MSDLLEILQWQRLWLTPFKPILKQVLVEAPSKSPERSVVRQHWQAHFNAIASRQKLMNHRGQRLRFIEQAALPVQVGYETFISATGQVPTRENHHDFFNALVWLTFPEVKTQLNAIQALEIERQLALQARCIANTDVAAGTTLDTTPGLSVRGTLRDRATIFDENAALMLTCDIALAESLIAHDWCEVLLVRRADFTVVWDVMLFGHALMEKLMKPYKAITAHLWIVHVDREFFKLPSDVRRQTVDRLLSQRLKDGLLGVPAAHLPILGVPEWWEGQDKSFYSDTKVFRPKRSR